MLLKSLMYVGLYLVGYLIAGGIMWIILYKCAGPLARRYIDDDKISAMLALEVYVANEKPLIGKSYGSVMYSTVLIGLWPIMVPAETVHITCGIKRLLIED